MLNADFEALREAYGKAQQDLEELRSELRLSHSNSQNNTSFLEERIESLNQRLISKTKEAEEGNKEAAAASITAEESEELLASKTDEIDALRMQMEFQSERISSLETQLEEAKNQSVVVETPRPIEMRTIATSVPTACGEPAQDREESFCIVRDGQQHEATPSEVESCISTVPPPRAEVMSRDETPPRNEEGAMHALQLVNNHLKEKLNKYKIKTEKLQAKNAELVRASRAKDSIMADMEVDLSAMKGKLMQTAEDYKTKYQECRRMTKTMQRKETRHHANKHAHVETTHPKLHKEKEASGKSPVAI